jgi:uncharacterized membrane protein
MSEPIQGVRTSPGRTRNRRGPSLVFGTLFVLASLAISALAVDIGMLYAARGEVKRIADASALAGASAFLGVPVSISMAVDSAKVRAKLHAGRSSILHTPVDTSFVSENDLTETSKEIFVEVDPQNRLVRVRVQRRGIGLWFARLLGTETAHVGAWAAAQAANPNRATRLARYTIPYQNYRLPWTRVAD